MSKSKITIGKNPLSDLVLNEPASATSVNSDDSLSAESIAHQDSDVTRLFEIELGSKSLKSYATNSDATNRNSLCIVKYWARRSAVGSLIPIPVVDISITMYCQIRMVEKLSEYYAVNAEKQLIKTIVTSLAAGSAGAYCITALGKSLVKTIPIVGTATILAGEPVVNYALTTAIGSAFIQHFENKKDLKSGDAGVILGYFKSIVAK